MSELLKVLATQGIGSPIGLPPRRPDDYNETLADMGKSAAAGTFGLPMDLLVMAAMPQMMNTHPDRVPTMFEDAPMTSDWLGKKMGVDIDSPAFILSQFLSPSPSDFAVPAAKFGAKLSPDIAAALSGMTAFHGSPHKFDKFSMDAIGTGEGAQVYGHGLYFAENKGVAHGYQKGLSYKESVNQFLDALPEDAEVDDVIAELGTGTFTEWQERVIRALEADDWLGFDYPSQAISQAYRKDLKNFDASQELIDAVRESGNIYEVDIPDEAIDRMLDWDKPLSEQSESVQRTVNATINDSPMKNGGRGLRIEFSKWAYEKGLDPQNPTPDMLTRFRDETGVEPHLWRDKNQNPTGKEIYEWMRSQSGTAEAASAALRELGIPGIKYLDGNSRSAGEGTRNFVVFDENTVKVISRNGEKLD